MNATKMPIARIPMVVTHVPARLDTLETEFTVLASFNLAIIIIMIAHLPTWL